MPPTLLLIRHAEAKHNATRNYQLRDPPLTKKGLQQCADLQKHLQKNCPLASKVEKIITSPMRRTCQTTLTALNFLIEKGIDVEVDATWQETSSEPCDTGTPRKKLSSLFPTLNFAPLDPLYPSKTGHYAFSQSAVLERAQSCLRTLYSRPESVVAIVSHAGFLRTGISRRKFGNGDYRIFRFAGEGEDAEDGRLGLVEDEVTEEKGGGMGRSAKGVFGIEEWDFPVEDQGKGEEEEEEEEDWNDGEVDDYEEKDDEKDGDYVD